MDGVISTLLLCGSSALLAWAVGRFGQRTRIRDLEALLELVQGISTTDIGLRLEASTEGRLRSGINRTLQGLTRRMTQAEARGLQWEKAVDAIEEVVFVIDGAGKILRANRAAAYRLETDVRALIHTPIAPLVADDDEGADRDAVALALDTGKPVAGSIGACQLGHQLQIQIIPLAGPDTRYTVVLRDELEQQRDKASLLSAVLPALSTPALVCTPSEGKVIDVNSSCKSTFEITAGTSRLEDLLAEPNSEDLTRLRGAVMRNNEEARVTLRGRGGDAIDVNVRGCLIRSASGAPALMLVTLEVIDAEHRVETRRDSSPDEALAPQVINAALTAMNGSVMVTDEEGRIQQVNRAACELFQRSPADMRGRTLDELHAGGPHERPYAAAAAAGGAWSGEVSRACPSGALAPTHAAIVPLGDGRSVVVASDRTAQRLGQEQIIAAERRGALHESAQAFIDAVNNPLTVMLESARWLADELRRTEADESIAVTADEVVAGADQIQAFIDRLRPLSPDASCNVACSSKIVDAALALVGPSLEAVAEIERGAGPAPELAINPSEAAQAVAAVLRNANEALQDGSRRGSVKIDCGIRDGMGYVQIADDGPGIPGSIQARLFSQTVTTKEREGAGHGLRLAFKVFEAAGGRVEVDSDLGCGATFTLYAPVVQGGRHEAETRSSLPSPTAAQRTKTETPAAVEDAAAPEATKTEAPEAPMHAEADPRQDRGRDDAPEATKTEAPEAPMRAEADAQQDQGRGDVPEATKTEAPEARAPEAGDSAPAKPWPMASCSTDWNGAKEPSDPVSCALSEDPLEDDFFGPEMTGSLDLPASRPSEAVSG